MTSNKLVGETAFECKIGTKHFPANTYSTELWSRYRRVREQFFEFVIFKVRRIIQEPTWII